MPLVRLIEMARGLSPDTTKGVVVMALPIWWQVVSPHKDILSGKLNKDMFAAKLDDVVQGNAPLEYQDASTFFQKTYLTRGLLTLLKNVLSRLEGKGGDPVIQLRTPFGGGKTHALLALYHIVKGKDEVSHLLPSELPKPDARVAVFVGTQADTLHGRTPWGEIAHQLGQYHIVEEHDKMRISPGKERLREVLDGAPTLILMDEVLEYITKANETEKAMNVPKGQTLAFLQELTEVVTSLPNCCLVITLPSSALEQYDEETERSLHQIQKITGRLEASYALVEGVELYEVIRKRLFEELGDEKTIRGVVDHYFNLYQSLGSDVPSETREVAYREKMLHAYPFHPELIDVLYERWGSFSTFQRTRGVLRLLAEVVADLYNTKKVSPLIQSSLVNLENPSIREEFLKHIGNEYDSIIAADVAGDDAKAAKMDRDMGTEYQRYGICQSIATSIFFYSFSGGESKFTPLSRVRIAVLREGIPPTIVGDAISKLEDGLWYMHSENRQYAFRTQPNLNRVIVDREETISSDRVEEKLRELLEKHTGNAFSVYIWPEGPEDIPDNKDLKLVVLSPHIPYSAEGVPLASELFERAGSGFRVYKNALFVLAVNDSQYTKLRRTTLRYLALSDIDKDKSMLERLTKQSINELKRKLKEAEEDIPHEISLAYRHLAVAENGGVVWHDMGMPIVGSDNLSERVKQYLESNEKLSLRFSSQYILDKTFGESEDEKTIREIYELHLKIPEMSVPVSEDVVINAVQEGVSKGIFGIRRGEQVYYNENVSPTAEDVVLRGEVAKRLKEEREKKEAGGGEIGGPIDGGFEGGTSSGDTSLNPPEPPRKVKKVKFRATVPWDKVSSLTQGVIGPLIAEKAELRLTIEIEASSEEGFSTNTLHNQVRETLKQIGAKIERWE